MRPTILMLFVLVTACAPMAEIDLQVIDPAEYTFPVHIQRLAFINCIEGKPIFSSDSTELTIEQQESLTFLAGKRAFEGVREALVNSPMYQIDTIKLLNYARFVNDSIPAPLSGSEVAYINRIHPADALIALEKYAVSDSTHAENVKSTEPRFVYHWLVSNSLWRIYDVGNDSILDNYKQSDTLIDRRIINSSKTDNDPYRLSFLIKNISKGAFRAGMIYGERISPAWIQVPRYYHKSGSKGMRQAARKAAEDDWDGAAEIWKKLAYTEEEKTAARACFNMALACEMEDLMVPALDWANKSTTLRPDTLTKEYIKILKERSEQLDELEKQVPDPE